MNGCKDMQNCLLNMQPSAFSHQKGAPRVREVQTRNHEALIATSPSSLGDFRVLLAISPLPSLVPIETQVGVVKLWAFNSSFQMSSIWSSWDYLAAIFDSGSGGLTWNRMNWVLFFSCGKRTFVCQSDETKIQFMKRDFYMLHGFRSLTTGRGRWHCPQWAGSSSLCKSVTPSESEGWVN